MAVATSPEQLHAGVTAGHWTGTRLAGLAGMTFAVSVVVQNVWANGVGILPEPGAAPAEVLDVFAAHDGAHGILLGWVAVNIAVLSVFLAGAHQRLRDDAPPWADLGLVGGVLLLVFFTLVNLPIVVLASGGEGLRDAPDLVAGLWAAHGAAFAFAGLALGIALSGLTLASFAAGLLPRWFRPVGLVGAAVIVLASVPVQAGAEGAPATMVGLLGFVAWLLFLLVFGVRLWREG